MSSIPNTEPIIFKFFYGFLVKIAKVNVINLYSVKSDLYNYRLARIQGINMFEIMFNATYKKCMILNWYKR